MDPEFWRERWASNRIGFHEGKPNAFLVKHFASLSLAEGARVFVPLCGKTRDIGWLLAQGARVVGVELSGLAVERLFAELGITPEIAPEGPVVRYSAPCLDILVGDIFDMTSQTLGRVDAVYDRAALVALPETMRARYAAHLVDITDRAPQLLLTFEYDPSLVEGPPFCVDAQMVRALYGATYAIALIDSTALVGSLKGQHDAVEHAWLLRAA